MALLRPNHALGSLGTLVRKYEIQHKPVGLHTFTSSASGSEPVLMHWPFLRERGRLRRGARASCGRCLSQGTPLRGRSWIGGFLSFFLSVTHSARLGRWGTPGITDRGCRCERESCPDGEMVASVRRAGCLNKQKWSVDQDVG